MSSKRLVQRQRQEDLNCGHRTTLLQKTCRCGRFYRVNGHLTNTGLGRCDYIGARHAISPATKPVITGVYAVARQRDRHACSCTQTRCERRCYIPSLHKSTARSPAELRIAQIPLGLSRHDTTQHAI